jgi:hypothetical protein
MTRVRRYFCCACLLLPAGCSGGHEASLTGVVTYQGQPVKGALMNLHNADSGPMAYAMTDDTGTYQALTGSQRGLQPGRYRFAFKSPADMVLPSKYLSAENSGLEYEVKPGKNVFDIELLP